jgi:hypothetical protein
MNQRLVKIPMAGGATVLGSTWIAAVKTFQLQGLAPSANGGLNQKAFQFIQDNLQLKYKDKCAELEKAKEEVVKAE